MPRKQRSKRSRTSKAVAPKEREVGKPASTSKNPEIPEPARPSIEDDELPAWHEWDPSPDDLE